MDLARIARADADRTGDAFDRGRSVGLYEAVSLIVQQADAFGLDRGDIGLEGVDQTGIYSDAARQRRLARADRGIRVHIQGADGPAARTTVPPGQIFLRYAATEILMNPSPFAA